MFNVKSDSDYEEVPVEPIRSASDGRTLLDMTNDQEIEAFHRLLLSQLRMMPSLHRMFRQNGPMPMQGMTFTYEQQTRDADGNIVTHNQVMFIPSEGGPATAMNSTPMQPMFPMVHRPRNAANAPTFRSPKISLQDAAATGLNDNLATEQRGFAQLANSLRTLFRNQTTASMPQPKSNQSPSDSGRSRRHQQPDKRPR